MRVAIPGRLELPTCGLGNRRSIRLSYGTERNAAIVVHRESLSERLSNRHPDCCLDDADNEAGSANVEYLTMSNKEPAILQSINVTSAHCSIANGNPFAS